MVDITIFDARGRVLPVSSFDPAAIAALDPEKRERFDDVRIAAAEAEIAEAECEAAQQHVNDCAAAVRDATQYRNDQFPPAQFHDLWHQTFKKTPTPPAPPPPRKAGMHDPKTTAYEEARAARTRSKTNARRPE